MPGSDVKTDLCPVGKGQWQWRMYLLFKYYIKISYLHAQLIIFVFYIYCCLGEIYDCFELLLGGNLVNIHVGVEKCLWFVNWLLCTQFVAEVYTWWDFLFILIEWRDSVWLFINILTMYPALGGSEKSIIHVSLKSID